MDNEKRTISVKELNDYVKSILENDKVIENVWIRGEISNLKRAMSGHYYFTLKDEDASISVALFKTYVNNLSIDLKDGQDVLIKGKVSIYQKTGSYQLYAQIIEDMGVGNIYKQIEQLKAKLQKEGLFNSEHKKHLPEKIEIIGVVTSSKGAVIHDIQKVVNKRNPFVEIILYPVAVQGESAPEEIKKGIEIFNNYKKVDVIIVGRGGGSLEDLMAFNDEGVIRAIFKSSIPVISAVGHETDITLSDYVADVRGATPSHGAELATISLKDNFRWLRSRMITDLNKIKRLLNENYINMDLKLDKLKKYSSKILHIKEDINIIFTNLKKNYDNLLKNYKLRLFHQGEKLHLLSPLALLTKGYSIVYDKNNDVINDVDLLTINDDVDIRMLNGRLSCKVHGKEHLNEE